MEENQVILPISIKKKKKFAKKNKEIIQSAMNNTTSIVDDSHDGLGLYNSTFFYLN